MKTEIVKCTSQKNYTEGITERQKDAKYRRLKDIGDIMRKANQLELVKKKKMSRNNVRGSNG